MRISFKTTAPFFLALPIALSILPCASAEGLRVGETGDLGYGGNTSKVPNGALQAEPKPYFSVFKGNLPGNGLFLCSKPEAGDWTFWDALARNPSPLLTDMNAIPSGTVSAATEVDIDGDGYDEVAVLKWEPGWGQNLYLYDGLTPPSQSNKLPIAYDFWIIPAGNNILMMANPGDVNGDGREDLAVVRREGARDYNLYIYNSPFRGDSTYEAAYDRNIIPMAYDKWIIPQGNDMTGVTGVDLDGDLKNDGLAVLRNQRGDYNLYVWKSPVAGDWFYAQAVARQNGYGGPGTPQGRDFWVIPRGNNIATMAPADVESGNPLNARFAVVKSRGGDQNLFVYNLPKHFDRTYWDAVARNPSPLARDFWAITAGNGITEMLSTN